MSKVNDAEEKLPLQLPAWKMWYIMIVLYFLYLIDLATRTIVSPMFPLLKQDLGLSDGQLGWLSTAVLATIGVLAIPLSFIIDRWRRGKMISIMAIVWSIASVCSGLATNFTQLITARASLGVAESSFNPAGSAMIMATTKKSRRATMMGIWTTAMAIGSALGLMVGGIVAVKFGWRTAFIAVAIPGIIFGILAWFMPDYKNPPKQAGVQGGGMSLSFGTTLQEILKNKTLVSLYIAYGLFYFVAQSITYWLPSYFNRYLGMPVDEAGKIAGYIMLSALVAAPLGGIVGDRISRNKPNNKAMLCWICLGLGMVCFIVALTFNIWWLFAVMTFFLYSFIPVQHTACQEVVPFYQRATAFGAYNFFMFVLGGLWGPAVTGMVSQATELRTAFFINIGVLVASLVCYMLMHKFFNADYKDARCKEEIALGQMGQ